MKADICDREAVYKLFEEEHPDMVVNFAAESHVDRSIEDPGVFLQTNIIGTATMMDACRKYGIQRYHQVSTDEVYGDLPWIDPTCSLPRRRLSTPPAPTPAPLPPTCWCRRITGPMVCLLPSAAAQQLWTVSFPGKTDSADDRQCTE